MKKFSPKFQFWILGIMVAAALVLRAYYYFLPAELSAKAELASYEIVSVRIGIADFTAYLADTPEKLVQGLSDVTYMPESHGMLFVFDELSYPSFWMKDMNFDLDFVWIRDGKVVELMDHVSSDPLNRLKSFRPSQPVEYVFELNAGEIAAHALKVGDQVQIFGK